MSEYDPLREHLARSGQPVLRMTFADIERVLGVPLPPSASKHPAWWANQTTGPRVECSSWMDAGYATKRLDLNGRTVEFARI